jgi:uncharacterized protein YjbI with pentapeptide repeats
VANDEYLALLRKGTAVWNEWRARNPDVKPDLLDADLFKEDLHEANLSWADLGWSTLSGANLRGADLSDACLTEADVSGADLSGADLSNVLLCGARIDDANLSNANLSRADLAFADLTKANLRGADLTEALFWETRLGDLDLGGVIGLDDCKHGGPSSIDFRTLSHCPNLPIAFLRGCGLPNDLIEYFRSLRSEAITFYSCFISYSVKDQAFADKLHADLQNKGVRCWFAPYDLRIGAKTWDAIDEAIRLRDKLLVVLSKAALASDWVEDEVSKALAEERSRKQVVLFPIRIDNAAMSTAEPWAVKFRDQRNIGDFRRWRQPAEYQKSLARLLRDLETSATK